MKYEEFLCDNKDVSGGIYDNLIDQHSLLSEYDDNNAVGNVPAKVLSFAKRCTSFSRMSNLLLRNAKARPAHRGEEAQVPSARFLPNQDWNQC